MYDNGLLKYFNDAKSKNGYINAKALGITQNIAAVPSHVKKVNIDGNSYYVKMTSTDLEESKSRNDAEILLSQLYSKLGIQSAIYLPAQNKYGQFLISDDVSKKNVVQACDYLFSCLSGRANTRRFPFLIDYTDLPVDPSDILTKNAMKEQTIMRILDTASFNYDRNAMNFFYKLEDKQCKNLDQSEDGIDGLKTKLMDFLNGVPKQKADGVVAIDYERSGIQIGHLLSGSDEGIIWNSYINDFDYMPLSKEEIEEEIQKNEHLAELVDKKALAEQIGSLNPHSVAQDIKETTGYEVDSGFVDIVAKSYDEMAETLIQ